jgi:predicted amino acid-binding ACT domain protein
MSKKLSELQSQSIQSDRLRHGKVIVTVTGKQSPGALGNVVRVLGPEGSYELVDFGQLVIRDRFVATAVLALPETATSSQDAIKDLLYRAHALQYHVDFEVLPRNSASLSSASIASISSMSSMENGFAQEDFIVTLVAAGRIPSGFLASATRIMAQHDANIRSINRLTEAADSYMCLEMVISLPREGGKVSQLRIELFELGRKQVGADVALQPARVNRMSKRIVVFDLSWTLVRGDAVDVLLDAAGATVSESSRLAHDRGELVDSDWLRARVATLKGWKADELNAKAFRALTFTDGAKELCMGLKKLGCQLAVVSSGSKKIAEHAKHELGLHFSYGNNFEVDSANRFTGTVSVSPSL